MNNILQKSFSFMKNLSWSTGSKAYKNYNENPKQRRPFERPKITEPEQLTINFNKNEVKNYE